MPCPHNEITIVQRSQRQSAVAAAAYQSGEKLFCEYDQQVKHYPEKRGIVHNEILLPANAPPEYADRNTLTGWIQRQSIRWCSSSAMTAHFMSLPSPSVKQIGTGAILPTTGLGPTPCPSPPIPTHGVLTATAIWPSTAIPVWSICFSARPAKPMRRSSRKPLSGTS